eukprot:858560-Rhodomonas_salina.3
MSVPYTEGRRSRQVADLSIAVREGRRYWELHRTNTLYQYWISHAMPRASEDSGLHLKPVHNFGPQPHPAFAMSVPDSASRVRSMTSEHRDCAADK